MIQKITFSNELELERFENVPEHDATCGEFRARWIDSADELEAIVPKWKRLGEMAVRKNLQLEANFLIPAFRHLNTAQARILVVERGQSTNPDANVLCALMPLEKSRFYKLPLRCYEIWRHEQCLDATPLIRRDCALNALRFVIEFLKNDGASLLSLNTVCGEDAFADLLRAAVQDQNLSVFQRDMFSRAAFRPFATVDEYVANNVSKNVRKKVGRLERRLREQGDFQVRITNNGSDFQLFAERFLELESSGWKGKEGTALACQRATQQFFEEMVNRSAAVDGVSFLTLELDGRPIAMLCDLYADGLGCAYKTAFDESYSQFSPGLLAEFKNIDHLHASRVQLMDSCTDPGNANLNRIWKDRLKYQSVVVALHGGLPKFATSIMPWLQSVARNARKIRKK